MQVEQLVVLVLQVLLVLLEFQLLVQLVRLELLELQLLGRLGRMVLALQHHLLVHYGINPGRTRRPDSYTRHIATPQSGMDQLHQRSAQQRRHPQHYRGAASHRTGIQSVTIPEVINSYQADGQWTIDNGVP